MSRKIGFLSPQGIFYMCKPWEHEKMASKICMENHNISYMGSRAEDFLLEQGYLIIKEDSAFLGYWNSTKTNYCLSDSQMEWIEENLFDISYGARKDIDNILLNEGKHQKWVERFLNVQ